MLRGMMRWGKWLLAIVAGLAAGLCGAWLSVHGGLGAGSAKSGPWVTSATTGSADAGLRTRATVAIAGLLALSAKEAIYFNAEEDSAGAPLDGRCRYRVTGSDPKARWWSITLYGADHFLVANPAQRFSFHMRNVPRAGDGGFAFDVAPTGEGARWLPTGGQARFALTLRAYNPDPAIIGRPDRAHLPRIEKVSCA
ncbi:hypothetical protein SmB9_04390 [Sphingosinicella microcystinivorans]|uniref:DUF1214 domain-containing protein n=2 Tax=Sphingosinicella microcystinivorans TaxID=335406 RepID=A0AAD1D2X1_SPHMI|nr:hypothetical protein DFR51_2239 [Sphingosinicella microcystinivorans]BBE32781.1 hypothetical protein SmB9_04390 [Sphingosinicella microcystinivorans]